MTLTQTLVVILATSCLATARAEDRPTVHVKNGSYQGIHNTAYNQDYFLGIPFAQPPTGQLRLALPQPLNESFGEARSATEFGPGCIGFSVGVTPPSCSPAN